MMLATVYSILFLASCSLTLAGLLPNERRLGSNWPLKRHEEIVARQTYNGTTGPPCGTGLGQVPCPDPPCGTGLGQEPCPATEPASSSTMPTTTTTVPPATTTVITCEESPQLCPPIPPGASNVPSTPATPPIQMQGAFCDQRSLIMGAGWNYTIGLPWNSHWMAVYSQSEADGFFKASTDKSEQCWSATFQSSMTFNGTYYWVTVDTMIGCTNYDMSWVIGQTTGDAFPNGVSCNNVDGDPETHPDSPDIPPGESEPPEEEPPEE